MMCLVTNTCSFLEYECADDSVVTWFVLAIRYIAWLHVFMSNIYMLCSAFSQRRNVLCWYDSKMLLIKCTIIWSVEKRKGKQLFPTTLFYSLFSVCCALRRSKSNTSSSSISDLLLFICIVYQNVGGTLATDRLLCFMTIREFHPSCFLAIGCRKWQKSPPPPRKKVK